MRRVEAEIVIKALPHEIVDAFLDVEALRTWWGVQRALVVPEVGGPYLLAWDVSDQGFGYLSTGTITSLDPMCHLLVSNYTYFNPQRPILGPLTLDVRATAIDANMSRLELCQAGYQNGTDWDWYHDAVTTAWPIVLKSTKQYLEDTDTPGTSSS